MKKFLASWRLRVGALMVGVLTVSGFARGATQYVVANDDVAYPYQTGVSFYKVAPNGLLTLQQQVITGGYGISGGFFGTNRISVLNSGNQGCIYASEALSGNIAGIVVSTLTLGGSVPG